LKTLSKIINARIVEIIEQVFLEIKNYGHDEQKKKLIAGIVITGGGSQLKHLKQLVEYITGMDTRIGYPNEHLAGDSEDNQTSPVYSTAVGLLMTALKENFDTNELVVENDPGDDNLEKLDKDVTNPENVRRSTIFERWTEKFKEFLDKA
jgi:cell division protein FtsA